jgi:vacuolar-type H+-ATPase subunit H
MEYMIKKIVSIDKEAEKYKEANQNQFQENKVIFERELKKIREEFENTLQKEKTQILDSELKKSFEEAENIRKQSENQYNKIMNLYLKLREDIVEDIFSELKTYMKEG